MAAERRRYTLVAVGFQWVIAAAIVIQILLGQRMGSGRSAPTYALFQLHKSIGITILVLSLGRLAWRLVNPPPPAPAGQPRWERIVSQVVHGGFYVAMIGLPLTGWLIVSSSRTNIPTILYGLIPWPHVPGVAELPAASKHVVNLASSTSHQLLVKLVYALLALHLGAVAKHQLLDRDEVFGHMAVGARPGWREPPLAGRSRPDRRRRVRSLDHPQRQDQDQRPRRAHGGGACDDGHAPSDARLAPRRASRRRAA